MSDDRTNDLRPSSANADLHRMDEVPEVRAAFLVSGRYDLVVHVVVSDTRHLKDLALDRFTNRPGVARIETSLIFDARRRHELPVLRPLR